MTTSRAVLHLAVAAATAALAFPAAASATDFCVNRTGCTPTNTYGPAGLQPALNAAGANANFLGRDRLLIGPGNYSPVDAAGFTYTGDPIEIIGSGSGSANGTKLSGVTGSNSQTLTVDGTGNRVADLSIALPTGDTVRGLTVSGAVQDVAVASTASSLSTIAIHGSGSLTLDRVTTDLPTTSGGFGFFSSYGVYSTGERLVVRDSSLKAYYGLSTGSDELLVQRLRSTARYPVIGWGATARVESSLLELAGTGSGVTADTSGRDTAMTVTNTTIVGGGGTNTVGVSAEGSDSGRRADVTMSGTVIRGVATPLRASTATATSAATISADYSDLIPAGNVTTGSGAAGIGLGANNRLSGADPRWVSTTGRDAYRLRFDSPLIDAAESGPVGSTSPFDAAGFDRVVGTRRDIGAFEYQRRAPVAATAASPAEAVVGEPVTFESAGSFDHDPGDELTYSWAWQDGATRTNGPTVVRTFATPGTHTATLTVTDSSGLQTTREQNVTVRDAEARAPEPPNAPAAPGPGAEDEPRQPAQGVGYRLIGVKQHRKGLDLLVSVANTTAARREISVGAIENAPAGKRPKSYRFTAVRRWLSAGRTTQIVLKVPKKLAPALKRQIAGRGKVGRKPRIAIKDLATGQTRTYTPKVVSRGKKGGRR